MTQDVDDFLAHYGVKGMKWGVRKAVDGVGLAAAKTNNVLKDAIAKGRDSRAATKAERKANFEAARNRGYTARLRNQDLQDVGRRGTRRIEKRIADGEKIGVARFKEHVATTARGFAIGTAILGAPIALAAADKGLANLASNINAKRGAEVARKLFADNKGLTSYQTVALAFDNVKGTWN